MTDVDGLGMCELNIGRSILHHVNGNIPLIVGVLIIGYSSSANL